MPVKPRRRRPVRASAAPAATARVAWLAGALATATVLVFVAWYVSAECRIPFWDQAGDWRKALAIAERLPHDPLGTFATVLRTIRRDVHNQLIALPLAPAVLLFGEARPVYVLAIAVIYGIAAAASIAWFTRRAFLCPLGAAPVGVALAVASIVVSPRLWLPILLGLPDVAGCIVVPLTWWALREPLDAIPRRRLTAIAVALALLVLLRRWYADGVLALLLALGVEQVLCHGLGARGRPGLTAALARLALLAGAALLAVVLVGGGAFGPGTGDGSIIGARSGASSLHDAASALLRDFGWLRAVLAAGGAVVALRIPATRPLARLLLAQALLVVALSAHTPGSRHEYLVLPQLAAFGAVAVATLAGARAARRVAPPLLLVLLALDFAVQLVPGVQASLGPAAAAFGRVAHPPVVRTDLAEVGRLVRTLDELTRAGHERIYVLASSRLLNEEVLANAHLADRALPDLHDRVLPVSHVDGRDGFPWALAQAGVIVTSEPTAYHRHPDEQRVVGVPADALRTGRGLGAAYLRRPEKFSLEDGSTVVLYGRLRDPVPPEIDELRRALAREAPTIHPR